MTYNMSNTANLIDNSRPLDLICMGRITVDFYTKQLHTSLEDEQILRECLGGGLGSSAFGIKRC